MKVFLGWNTASRFGLNIVYLFKIMKDLHSGFWIFRFSKKIMGALPKV